MVRRACLGQQPLCAIVGNVGVVTGSKHETEMDVVIWTLGAVYFRSEDPRGFLSKVRDFADELGNRAVG